MYPHSSESRQVYSKLNLLPRLTYRLNIIFLLVTKSSNEYNTSSVLIVLQKASSNLQRIEPPAETHYLSGQGECSGCIICSFLIIKDEEGSIFISHKTTRHYALSPVQCAVIIEPCASSMRSRTHPCGPALHAEKASFASGRQPSVRPH